MSRVFLLSIILTALAPFAAAADAVARLDTLLADTQTWRAEFVQTVFDEHKRLLQDSRGLVYIHRPGKFRWVYAEPDPQLIVADGDRVWIYDQELQQVTVRPLDQALGNTPALLLMHRGGISGVFTLTSLGTRAGLDWVELVPKAEGATFERFRLGFDEYQIRVLEMADNFGQTTELRFSDAATNIELDADLFRFTPPSGADVIQGE